MFDQDDGVARIQQLAKGPHQLGNVVKVQTRGGLVEHEERAFARDTLARLAGLLSGFHQVARQFQALRFAA